MRNFQTGQGLPVTGVIDAATWPALLRQPIAAPDWNGAGAATASAAGARTARRRRGCRPGAPRSRRWAAAAERRIGKDP